MSSFLITIDTEGDNIWDNHSRIDTKNAAHLPRFQALCERYGLKPTYLVNYEMAIDPIFVDFGRDLLARDAGEIGMHLHAWNSPPLHALTADDGRHKPFLIEYPPTIVKEKLRFMTYLLEDTFGVKMVSHRAGRWALNEAYAGVLRDLGYQIDCSVTPHIDWRRTKGHPKGTGGVDYRAFPETHYWMSEHNIGLPGYSTILEVPVTILSHSPEFLMRMTQALAHVLDLPEKLRRRIWPTEWLRPNGQNLQAMLNIIDAANQQNRPYVEFMMHSSELMPAGSPYFPTEASIENLYSNLIALFAYAAKDFCGATLKEFYAKVSGRIKS